MSYLRQFTDWDLANYEYCLACAIAAMKQTMTDETQVHARIVEHEAVKAELHRRAGR